MRLTVLFILLLTFGSCGKKDISVETKVFEKPDADVSLTDGEATPKGGAILVGNIFDIATDELVLYDVDELGKTQSSNAFLSGLQHPLITTTGLNQYVVIGTTWIESDEGEKAVIEGDILHPNKVSSLAIIEADNDLYPVDLLLTPEEDVVILQREEETSNISWPRITVISMEGEILLNIELKDQIPDSKSSFPEKIIYSDGSYYLLCSDRTAASTAIIRLDDVFNTRETSSYSWDGWNYGTSLDAIGDGEGFIMTVTSYQDHGIEKNGIHLVRLSEDQKILWDEHITCDFGSGKALVTKDNKVVFTAVSEGKDQLLIHTYSIEGEKVNEHFVDLDELLDINDLIELEGGQVMIVGTLREKGGAGFQKGVSYTINNLE